MNLEPDGSTGAARAGEGESPTPTGVGPDAMDRREEQSEHLRQQLDRTRQTYLRMREAGYDKRTKLALRFGYRPSEMENAFDLAGMMREHTKHHVEAMEVAEGWLVRGETKPVKIDAATLGRWVYWMCTSGYRYGVYFDGWGTRLSEDA